MERSDRGSFEKAWEDRFSDAKLSPSSDLWEKVNAHLVLEENGTLRKNILWMRWLSAAAISLAVISFTFQYSNWTTDQSMDQSIAVVNEEEIPLDSKNSVENEVTNSPNTPSATGDSGKADKQIGNSGNNSNAYNSNQTRVNQPKVKVYPNRVSQNQLNSKISFSGNFNSGFPIVNNNQNRGNSLSNISLSDQSTSLTALDGLGLTDKELGESTALYLRYEMLPTIVKDENNRQSFYAGLNYAGGSVSEAGNSLSFANSLSDAISSPEQSDNYSKRDIEGVSRVVGLNLGGNISEKWKLMTGVEYQQIVTGSYFGSDPQMNTKNINTAYTSFNNSTSMDPGYLQEDQLSYLSIPLQAGYEIFDKKLGITLISGLDTRILIDNSSVLFTQDPINNSTVNRNFNSLTLWGGLNAEISYELTRSYEIAVIPGFRQSLMEVERNSGNRSSLSEIAFNLRYKFN